MPCLAAVLFFCSAMISTVLAEGDPRVTQVVYQVRTDEVGSGMNIGMIGGGGFPMVYPMPVQIPQMQIPYGTLSMDDTRVAMAPVFYYSGSGSDI